MQDRGAEFADKIHARDEAKVLQPMDARLRHFVCRGVIPQGCNAHAKGNAACGGEYIESMGDCKAAKDIQISNITNLQ